MKRCAPAVCLALLVCAASALAASTPIGKFTLAPGEKVSVVVEATSDTTVGFLNEGSVEDAKRCRKTCIRMSVPGNPFQDAAAAIGTSMKISPTGGKIQVLFENLEDFPISIGVFRE